MKFSNFNTILITFITFHLQNYEITDVESVE